METGISIHMTPRIEDGKFEHSIRIDELEKKIIQDSEGNDVINVDFENSKTCVNFRTIDEQTMNEIISFVKEKLNGK